MGKARPIGREVCLAPSGLKVRRVAESDLDCFARVETILRGQEQRDGHGKAALVGVVYGPFSTIGCRVLSNDFVLRSIFKEFLLNLLLH